MKKRFYAIFGNDGIVKGAPESGEHMKRMLIDAEQKSKREKKRFQVFEVKITKVGKAVPLEDYA